MTPEAGITDRIIERTRAVGRERLPEDVLTVAKTCMLDHLGCALAGSTEPVTRVLVNHARDTGEKRAASVIGHDMKVSPGRAASINATASHALDYDDTLFMSPSHPIHPSAPVLPAVLALAEDRRRAGADALAAFVAGVEAACLIGRVIGPGHYAAGWHSTGTLGTFGAATACAALLGLDQHTWRHTFGIAASQAAGLKSMFGTMSKPFQVGRAAANGLLAAELAAAGMTSEQSVIEAPQGFAATHHGSPDVDLDEGERFGILSTVFKYHASCYLTHSAIEAVRTLAGIGPFDVSRIGSIDVAVPETHLAVCNIAEPATGLEGKFSLRATVAMALLGADTSDPASFSDGRMRSTELVSLRDKVSVMVSPEMTGTQTKVSLRMNDSSKRSQVADTGVPASDLRAQWTAIARKFDRLASPIIGPDRARTIYEMVSELEDVKDVTDVLVLCRPSDQR